MLCVGRLEVGRERPFSTEVLAEPARRATPVRVLLVLRLAHQVCYKSSRTSRRRALEVDGFRWASPSSKRLLGQLPVRGWVRLPCTSATRFELKIRSNVLNSVACRPL